MDANIYFQAVLRTAKNDYPHLARFHWCLGIMGEVGEVMAACNDKITYKVMDECGDLLWYLANYCHAYELSFVDIIHDAMGLGYIGARRSFPQTVSHLMELTKKREFYQHKTISNMALSEAASRVINAMMYECGFRTNVIYQIMQMNIEKLETRYPQGFDG